MQENGTESDIMQIQISNYTSDELFSEDTFDMIFREPGTFRREQLKGFCFAQAKKLRVTKEFAALLKAYSIELAKKSSSYAGGNKTEFIDQPLQLNCGEWTADNSGVYKQARKADGGYDMRCASPIPVLVTEILENVEDGTEKIRIAFFKNGWQSFLCRRSTAASNNKVIELADYGLEVCSENAKWFVRYLADLIALNLDIIPRYKATSKMGWVGNEFVPYCDFRFDGENEFGTIFNSITEQGDFIKWRDCINKLRTESKLFRFQLAASFSSVLISKLNILPWIFHMWGGTGNGKTVGLMAAASVWGSPQPGKLTRTMNMTINSVMTTASFLNNIPFAGDELQTIKHFGNYDQLIMQCTEGIGRGRMKYDSLQKPETWKCIFMFTGEEPVTRDNSGGGAKNRVIEIECNEKIVQNGNETVRVITENYGHAGKMFVTAVSCLGNRITDIYRGFYDDILKYDVPEKQAMAAACMLCGDVLAEEYVLNSGMRRLTADDILPFLLTNDETDTAVRAYDYIMNVISVNANKFSEDANEVWGRIDDMYIWINKQVLVDRLRENNFEFDAVKKKWAENKWLICNSQGRYIQYTKCYGVKAQYIKLKFKYDDTQDLVPF